MIGKSGAQTKRNAVNIDGYESDSDNDNFDARAADREKRTMIQLNSAIYIPHQSMPEPRDPLKVLIHSCGQ